MSSKCHTVTTQTVTGLQEFQHPLGRVTESKSKEGYFRQILIVTNLFDPLSGVAVVIFYCQVLG